MRSKAERHRLRRARSIARGRETLARLEQARITRSVEAEENARRAIYVNYGSTLEDMQESLGINVADELQRSGSESFLDVGCGRAVTLGQLESRFPKVTFHGFNYRHEPEFDRLRRTRVAIGHIKDLHLHYPTGSIGFAIWNYGQEHSPDVRRDLNNIASVLKPGGRLAFNVHPANAFHDERAELEKHIERAGFKIIRANEVKYRGVDHWADITGTTTTKRPSIAYLLEKKG